MGTNRISRLLIPDYYVGVSRKLWSYWREDALELLRADLLGRQYDCEVWLADWMGVGDVRMDVDYNAWWKEGDVYGAAGGSLFPMLQVGLELGFEEFEILGCDGFNGNIEDVENHWDPGYWDHVSDSPSVERLNSIVDEGHKAAAERMSDYEVIFGTPSPFEKHWRQDGR